MAIKSLMVGTVMALSASQVLATCNTPSPVFLDSTSRMTATLNINGQAKLLEQLVRNEPGYRVMERSLLRLITQVREPNFISRPISQTDDYRLTFFNAEALYARLLHSEHRVLIEKVELVWPSLNATPYLLINDHFMFAVPDGADETILQTWLSAAVEADEIKGDVPSDSCERQGRFEGKRPS